MTLSDHLQWIFPLNIVVFHSYMLNYQWVVRCFGTRNPHETSGFPVRFDETGVAHPLFGPANWRFGAIYPAAIKEL